MWVLVQYCTTMMEHYSLTLQGRGTCYDLSTFGLSAFGKKSGVFCTYLLQERVFVNELWNPDVDGVCSAAPLQRWSAGVLNCLV